ncbi:hypothetical protein F5Y17DRAFT_248985 [Xylariaceae sp. FL0594]|nr:hypothetical protein F5Y17DRAFT_248985 [Xylariaceae sp. FL0594]
MRAHNFSPSMSRIPSGVKLRWETETLLKTGRVDVESRHSPGLTPLERALLPSSGSSEIAALLLRHGAALSEKPMEDILWLINNIYRARATVIYAALSYKKALAPLLQLLLNYCSSTNSESREGFITAFMNGCSPWIVAVVAEMKQKRLTNSYLLYRFKEKFNVIPRFPRKVKPMMECWWDEKKLRRRLNQDQ